MHRIYNFGSILQTYATQKIFEKHGFDCEIIDYVSPNRKKLSLFFDCPEKFKNNIAKRIIYYIGKIPSFILKDITFGGFLRKYINLSKNRYYSFDELKRNPPIADYYVTGSDQVWNSKYNGGVDKSFYLKFANDNANKIAFVASFGNTQLSDEENNAIKPMLQEYNYLSVREDSAVDILSNIGLNSICLVDPTLQISKEEWQKISTKRIEKSKYLLLFLLYNEDNGATEYAQKIAKERDLKIVKLSWELKKPSGVDKLYTHRRPQDFLSLFNYANFIVTNSFHGVAFSINLNKQFAFVPRCELNGRIESLLRLTGLSKQKVNDFNISVPFVEYKEVNEILNKERQKADRFLQNALKLEE